MSATNNQNRKIASIGTVFNSPTIPNELAGVVRAHQLASVATLVPAIMMAQLISGAVLLMAFWSSGADQLLGLWATALCFACGATMLRNVRSKSTHDLKTRSKRSIERMARGSAILGIIWGVVPIIVVPNADSVGHMTLGTIMVAMAFAGCFLLARIPSAAFGFVLPIMICLLYTSDAADE